jgi:hypothetical protein
MLADTFGQKTMGAKLSGSSSLCVTFVTQKLNQQLKSKDSVGRGYI